MRPFSRSRPHKKSDDGKLAVLIERHGITLVLDIGANEGQTRDRLRNLGYEGRIISFEPLPELHARLSRRAERDILWTVGPRVAVSDRSGDALINVSEATDMSSLRAPADALLETLPKSRSTRQERVETISLDSLWLDGTWDRETVLLKIDAQGSEADILRGAGRSLPKVSAVLIEMSLEPIYDGEDDYIAVCSTLHDKGFRPALFMPGYFSQKLGRLLQMDGFFIRP